jgi:hypothetical protein
VPYLPKHLSATAALRLAETACTGGSLHDEAPLHQLLHVCSAALCADVLAAASAREPAAAAGIAATDAITAGAAHAGAAPAAVKPDRQISPPQQQPELLALPPQQEWESHWGNPVTLALEVRELVHAC